MSTLISKVLKKVLKKLKILKGFVILQNMELEQGFNRSNAWLLFLLTVAFVIGEISHFLVGTVSQEMARSLNYGDKSCVQHSNASMRFGRTNSECDKFNEENCERQSGKLNKQ